MTTATTPNSERMKAEFANRATEALADFQRLASDIAAGVEVDDDRTRIVLFDVGRGPDDLVHQISLEERRQRAHATLREARQIRQEVAALVERIKAQSLDVRKEYAALVELLGSDAGVQVVLGRGSLGRACLAERQLREEHAELCRRYRELMTDVDRELAALEGDCCTTGYPTPEMCGEYVPGPSGTPHRYTTLRGRPAGSPPPAPAFNVGPSGWSIEIAPHEWKGLS